MNYEEYPHSDGGSILVSFMYKVYGWMSVGLAVTAGVAYYLFRTQSFALYLRAHPGTMIWVFLLQIALIIILGMYLFRMSFTSAILLFVVFAASLGVSLSSIFFVYTMASIFSTFLVASGMFGVMCLYGYFTKTDLTRVGNLAMMGLFGLILALFANFFLRSAMFDYVLSGIGVVVFVLLTAYETQKLKQIGQRLITDEQGRKKMAIYGALTLYLDFINLFLFLLRFMGNRREG